MADKKWYIFKRNEDMDYVRLRKTFDSKKEACDYAADHNYQFAMISNTPDLYREGEYFHG